MSKLVTIMPLGGNLFLVTEVGGGIPDNTLPTPPGHPGNALPPSWPGYPTTGPVFPGKPVDPGYGIPPGLVWWPVRPDNSLPAHPGAPDNSLPAIPGVPDNTLPTTPPPTIPAGHVLVMVRTADRKWHWAVIEPGKPVPTPLPETPPTAAPKAS